MVKRDPRRLACGWFDQKSLRRPAANKTVLPMAKHSWYLGGEHSWQTQQIAVGYVTRERFLTELTLDPPDARGAEAGRPELDEDYLILSTIHSAKGQEWDAVFVLNLVDGCIPSDMASGGPDQYHHG
jgi:superfamily I DNA/RNA helicase